jgi:glycerophosphoryl diester phosphodiesterase
MGVRSGLAFAAAMTALLASASSAGAATDWLELRTLNIAHQGGENEAPSNTMYAYERALRMGADMLEVDVHTTADGHLVVMHDGTVDRTTDGSGQVATMTLAQIRRLDGAYDFVPGLGPQAGRPERDYRFRGIATGERNPPTGFRPRDFRVPTLAEVLRAYPEVPINIEIKGTADADLASFLRNAEHLAALLNRVGRTDGVIVASFNDLAVARFHELAPEVATAPGITGVAQFKLANVPPPPGTAAFQVPTEFQGIQVTDPDFIGRAHQGGYAVHVWTINEPPLMRTLLGWGVEGIMTAEPMRLERVLCADEVARPPGRHCRHRRASIACDVRPRGRALVAASGRVRIELERSDEFPGRCAGKVTLRTRVPGEGPVRGSGRFSFGALPPGDGGPAAVAVRMPLRRGIDPGVGGLARVVATPYAAFSRRESLELVRLRRG